MTVPEIRIRAVNDAPVRQDGRFVLYFMVAARRTRHSFGFDRAVERCRELGLPLLVLEALRVGYPHASPRIHRFVLQGMAANAARLAGTRVRYHPYVEPEPGDGRGLLKALGREAAVVVTDDSPAFFLPKLVAAAGNALEVRLEAVDGNGLLPLRSTERVFPTAYAFRRFLQKELPPHLARFPRADPLAGLDLPRLDSLPDALTGPWPRASDGLLAGDAGALAALPLDHRVGPVPTAGGSEEGRRVLARFVNDRLADYGGRRNEPEAEATSGLSPYLHFGHVSPHDVFARVAAAGNWSPDLLNLKAGGKRTGYWGMGESAEGFLDQLVTWREVGHHTAAKLPDYDAFETLPGWAIETLADHEKDPRPHLYTLEDLEHARTHDELWNAAQNQLRREGRIHNYLRMLWGKKILEWSETPRLALDSMVELNDRYALDGRDPNSVSGIFWCLGRYDRPWGPERPIFGKVRYMTSASTARKLRVRGYVERYTATGLF